jgi:BCD family chlorophyll transporter-like MFS transporter
MDTHAARLSWTGIFRLGLVQTALGAVVVLTTSTLNRVMVVELALPALLPGALVALHYAVQMLRPRMGYGSDAGGARAPWIVGGMATLAAGGTLAAVAVALMGGRPVAGMALAAFAFVMIGLGVGAAGTSLLALLAKQVAPERRPAAATIVWMMMIAGFAVTAGTAGKFLEPYSAERLIAVTATVSAAAFFLALFAVRGVERAGSPHGGGATAPAEPSAFRAALAQVWKEPAARRFTVFVFVSMLAYSMQDLILEPFAGSVFGYTPGESTQLAGLQHAGVFAGMLVVALAASGMRRVGSLRAWAVGGCVASGASLVGIAAAGFIGPGWPLQANVFALGVANGAFAVAAIGSMMDLAGEGRGGREGTRVGLWGAAQAIAFGLGGFAGTALSDFAQAFVAEPGTAYASVFAFEAALFAMSAVLAYGIARPARSRATGGVLAAGIDGD